jgi:hypothetical protein
MYLSPLVMRFCKLSTTVYRNKLYCVERNTNLLKFMYLGRYDKCHVRKYFIFQKL